MKARQVLDPVPAPGRPIRYLHDGRLCQGAMTNQVRLAAGAHVWVKAIDGFVLVTRVEGRWTSVPVPEGMPIGSTPLATEHRDAPVEPQDSLW